MTPTTQSTDTKAAIRRIEAITKEATRLGVEIDLKPWLDFCLNEKDKTDNWLSFVLSTYGKVHMDAWGTEATVYLRFKKSDDNRSALGIELYTQVSWSSTQRTPANAYLAIRLYERAIEFAASAEAIWNS
jgi:hypothetical protein